MTIASDHRASGSAATFEYANLIITGMGRLRADVLDTGLRALAVWDPAAAGSAGGAASVVSMWARRGLAVEQVRLPALRAGGAPAVAVADAPGAGRRRVRRPRGTRSGRCSSRTPSATAS